jgi:cysteine desulfurase
MDRFEYSAANPSALYSEALAAKEAVRSARTRIAEIFEVTKESVVFTSGGTESNNLAILGVFEKFKTPTFTPHFIMTAIEHPSVLEVFKEIERRGGEVSIAEVTEEGLVRPETIRKLLRENTVLVSVMYANNEIGTVQPVKAVSRELKEWREKGVSKNFWPYLHVDASQAALYLPLNMQKIGADLLTLDGIKMYGPRGAGILYVKPTVEISPIVFGGGQERGLRSGTENVPAIVGFAEALSIAESMKESERERLRQLQTYAIGEIKKNFPNSRLNGSSEHRLPNNVNVCFDGLDAEFAVISLDVLGISASYSSSCRTLKEDSSSYVVESLGHPDCAMSSLRFTFGRETTKEDIDKLLVGLRKVIK